ncbi:GMC oxidoreductase [Trichocoleus sp. FACHB-262]|uniref:GMC oxidoreductase n=1 Tax=Trichocoleus sp. FACHB-262 TaxID=2692869 RepID=UPI0016863A19|nr:GMC family oxidoreductase [Trichocoleus sp. FACHB-262]MBD2119882.1 GMC family oxidoreductase [Trichocoleus sp. FACHB-262]
MLIDARTLPAGTTIESDVCIIGAGPAGITLAREFIGQDFRVCLLESGGAEPDQATQSLCEGENSGDLYQDLCKSRHRQFGGTANEWHITITPEEIGGRCGPLEAIDFEKRDGIPYTGWPFDRAYLDPFYQRAQQFSKMGPFAYQAEDWEEAQSPRLPFLEGKVATAIYQFTLRGVFTQEYREELRQADNITTYLNANVLDIETNEVAKTVTRLQAACLDGDRFWVTAKLFILATGGIENARLMLLADQNQNVGLGNQNDLVGRFFMDHPGLSYMFFPKQRQIFNSTALYDLRRVKGSAIKGKLVLTEEVKRREHLLNSGALIHPRPKGFRSQAVSSLKTLLSSARQAKVPPQPFKHLGNVVSGADELALSAYRRFRKIQPILPNDIEGGWSHLPNKEKQFASFQISQMIEQAPNPDSRVMLSDERDRLGRRKVKLHWTWHELDVYSVKRTYEILDAELRRSGIGRLESDWQFEGKDLTDTSAHHHIGTTRMHNDPKQGVVDENCQVHGISNLFVAGSSVFPTGGYVNPTLTIIALALRLADHVKQQMAARVASIN